MIRSASFVLSLALGACGASFASAQTAETPLDRQLSRIDLAVSGAGQFNRTVSGKVLPTGAPNAGTTESENASNTVGALATLRYVYKPYLGGEANFSYARYTENFSYPPPTFGVQTNAQEFSIGYLITPPHPIFGLQPFASAGMGSIKFQPTRGGGEGLPIQARAAYYYSVGVQQELFESHFGVRAGFRQVFNLAPDFGQNYFTIKQHTITSEPTVGFYLRF